MKPKSVHVTVNTDENETYHEFKGNFTGLDNLVEIIDNNVPKWTSMVLVFCNPKTHD